MSGATARYRVSHRLVDLALTTLGFGVVLFWYDAVMQGGLSPAEALVSFGSSVIAFWLALQFKNWGGPSAPSNWVIAVEQFCFGTGINLLLHALMTYGLLTRRTPVLIVGGSFLSTLLLAANRKWIFGRHQMEARVLIVGFDTVTEKLLTALRLPVLGIVGPADIQCPPDIPFLGGLDTLPFVVDLFRPTHLLIGKQDWENWIPASVLLRFRRNGIIVEEAESVYERLFDRVCCERLQPMDLLLSSALRGDSRTMAVQAVYTNVIALTLLLIFSPLFVLISLAVFLTDRGSAFESIECAGFQYIPFRLLRFRTSRKGGSAGTTAVGRLIKSLRLVNLPQLINIVRGDMALVGPLAVRREFATYLTTCMPFYSHRFSVKPGIIGWARLHSSRHFLADECRQVEYDLYYIKEGSLWLDLEIFFRALFGGGSLAEGARLQARGAARGVHSAA